MTFLPIVDRELRVASRKRGTYINRLGAVVVALIVSCFFGAFMERASVPPAELGSKLFEFLAWISYIYCLFVGVLTTSDCLSIEKREGTMGLLFLTDLKGFDVVLGKLVATSLNAFYGMLAIFPILAVPLLLGGVTATEFTRVIVVCLNLMFFSLGAGMFASAISTDERKAMGLTIFITLGLAVIPLLIGLYFAAKRPSSEFPWLALAPSPAVDGALALEGLVPGKPDYFWPKILVTHIYAWVFLIASCVIVPRSWHEASLRTKVTGWKAFFHWLTAGSNDTRLNLRRRLLDINPFYWLAGHTRGKIVFLWSFLCVVGFIWLWCWGTFRRDWLNEGNYIVTAIILHAFLKYSMATESCRRLVEDRRSGALELLLSTPMEVEDILRGQRLALLRQFAGPASAVLIVDFIFLILGLTKDSYRGSEEVFWLFLWFAGVSVFVFDLVALSWTGMWLGMTSRGAHRAAMGAFTRVVVLPWAAFLLVMFFMALGSFVRSSSSWWHTEYFILLFWFGLCVGNNVFFIQISKNNLRSRFRDIATQRFDARVSRLKQPSVAQPAVAAPPMINDLR